MLKKIAWFLTIFTGGISYPAENWNGKWFPHSPSNPDLNPVSSLKVLQDHHGITMGVQDPRCDDAKTNLERDWFLNPENYTCYEDRSLFQPDGTLHPIHSSENIPAAYSAPHKCMNESIEYSENVPTFGVHRPLWAVYGEYTFLPKQRWLHNLEHGAVVMLYHPCANKNEVRFLKKIIRSCLYKHVITPYNLLKPERPLALLTWGHRLEISKVAPAIAIDFIRNHALRGSEQTTQNGQYTVMLEKPAGIVSNINDTNLCPNNGNINMK